MEVAKNPSSIFYRRECCPRNECGGEGQKGILVSIGGSTGSSGVHALVVLLGVGCRHGAMERYRGDSEVKMKRGPQGSAFNAGVGFEGLAGSVDPVRLRCELVSIGRCRSCDPLMPFGHLRLDAAWLGRL